MKDNPPYERLLELSWKRKLTPAEVEQLRALLAAHPESQIQWEAEMALSDALARLPEAPVPTNFTARVLQASALAAAVESRQRQPVWHAWFRPARWLPRAALAAVVMGSGLVAYRQVQVSRRNELVRSVAAVSEVSSMPSPKILEDFDAIRAMSPAPAADEQLLTLLQ
jgi:hypothetical protein